MTKTSEIIVKLEIPVGIERELAIAIKKTMGEFIENTEYSLAKEIIKESRLTSEQAKELGKEVNSAVAKRH